MENKNSKGLEARTSEAARLLQEEGRWLTPEELKQVYASIYPKLKTPSTGDKLLLQPGLRMTQEVIAAELGPDMVKPYQLLEEHFLFQYAGQRLHALDPSLRRHLWDTAYRAHLMGLPLETRLAAVMHDLPEFKSRSLSEAFRTLKQIEENFGPVTAKYVSEMTDFEAIMVREVFYTIQRNGSKDKSAKHYCTIFEERTAKIGKNQRELLGNRCEAVKQALKQAFDNRTSPSKQLVHVTADAASEWLEREVLARTDLPYVNQTYEYARKRLENGEQGYDTTPIIKAIAHIDRLRTTMGGFLAIEQASRKSLDFLPRLEKMLTVLRNSGIVNNNLHFLSAALKTELYRALDRATVYFYGTPDTTARTPAKVMNERLERVIKAYRSDILREENPRGTPSAMRSKAA